MRGQPKLWDPEAHWSSGNKALPRAGESTERLGGGSIRSRGPASLSITAPDTSGARYSGVPQKVFMVAPSLMPSLHRPKSVILMWPSLSSMRFSSCRKSQCIRKMSFWLPATFLKPHMPWKGLSYHGLQAELWDTSQHRVKPSPSEAHTSLVLGHPSGSRVLPQPAFPPPLWMRGTVSPFFPKLHIMGHLVGPCATSPGQDRSLPVPRTPHVPLPCY